MMLEALLERHMQLVLLMRTQLRQRLIGFCHLVMN
jgi:hypothetical protein